ncbi:rhamnulokinase family protein [Victivallis sp. Marseille-Q1083]|uniref:rhamnulokinase n=1 Tax=Victivallis sp. Marseille-Q1083 TaxID=2717288 RepID=UPI0015882C37|nr:rhamnulokinase family protein [Victivallis sp. Marseille-Q1083]
MTTNYLAFDLGASSGRAMIGTIHAGKLSLTEVHRFANGPLERDGALYWDLPALSAELETGIRKAAAACPNLAAIGIDTWGVDYCLFKRGTRELVRLPYNYRDPRTGAIPPEVFRKIGRSQLYRRTGMQFMPINTLYQLLAHHRQHPEDFVDSFLLPVPDALGYLLGGNPTCEYTDASTSNLLNPRTCDWDYELLDLLGLPRALFPPVVPPGSDNGTLSEALQQRCHCGPIRLVKVGSHDTASAVAAVPAPVDRPWAYISCGTWALLGAEVPAPILSAEAEAAAFTNEGGLAGRIRFLTNIMGSWLFQEVRRVWNESGRKISFAEMEAMAAAAPGWRFLINPNDSSFLTPGDMPAQIAAFCRRTGQGDLPDDAALLRCIYDSLALCFRAKLETLQQLIGVEYGCLNIIGGGVKDRRLLRSTASALGIPVVGGPVEATATGNIIAQAMATGVLPDLEAGREMVKCSFALDTVQPVESEKSQWDAAMPRFRQLAG